MAECSSIIKQKRAIISSSFENSLGIRILRKYKKGRFRVLRRKRSKLKYRRRQKQLRLLREFKELSERISFFDITDTDMEVQHNNVSLLQPIDEVVTWHQQQQLAYWKSRALALQCENKVLKQHLREAYKQQVEDYAWSIREADVDHGNSHIKQLNSNKEKQLASQSKPCQLPMENLLKQNKEKTTLLYGDMAPKISGMETAIQLNYDSYLDRHNPPFWPNIPLKL